MVPRRSELSHGARKMTRKAASNHVLGIWTRTTVRSQVGAAVDHQICKSLFRTVVPGVDADSMLKSSRRSPAAVEYAGAKRRLRVTFALGRTGQLSLGRQSKRDHPRLFFFISCRRPSPMPAGDIRSGLKPQRRRGGVSGIPPAARLSGHVSGGTERSMCAARSLDDSRG